MSDFKERIKEERAEIGLNQADFGRIGGVSLRTQGQYERGISYPCAEYLSAIAKEGVDVLYVLTGEHLPDRHETIVYIGDEKIDVSGWSEEAVQAEAKRVVAEYNARSENTGKPALSKDPATFAKELESALKLISEESARIGWQMPRSMQKGLATIAADGIDQALLIQLVKLLWTECEKE